jgi:hypothetical protein
MKYGTRIAYGVMGGAAALALTLWLGASNSEVAIVLIGILDWLPLDRTVVLNNAEAAGVFAIGSGVGMLAWLVTGREAFRCLGQRAPRAWHLWRRDALTSLIPVLKYTALGLLMGGLGAYLMQYLWGLWTTAYSAGLAAGAFGGSDLLRHTVATRLPNGLLGGQPAVHQRRKRIGLYGDRKAVTGRGQGPPEGQTKSPSPGATGDGH